MKIISWNVNGLRSVLRKGVLQDLLAQYDPDVLAMQEIKCPEGKVNLSIFDGYSTFIHSGERAGRHGTMFIVKGEIPVRTHFTDTWEFDGYNEGRVIVLLIEELALITSYTVNIQEGLARSVQRNDFDTKLLETIRMTRTNTSYPILMGDLNVISQPLDIHRGKINPDEACQSPMERENFQQYLTHGLVDTWRHFNPEPTREYTYWSNIGQSRKKNLGWRLDYFLTDSRLINKVTNVQHLTQITGSDHCPILLELKDV